MKNKFDRKNVTITVLLNEKLKKQKKKNKQTGMAFQKC